MWQEYTVLIIVAISIGVAIKVFIQKWIKPKKKDNNTCDEEHCTGCDLKDKYDNRNNSL